MSTIVATDPELLQRAIDIHSFDKDKERIAAVRHVRENGYAYLPLVNKYKKARELEKRKGGLLPRRPRRSLEDLIAEHNQ
jgi:hypothetical protein